MKYKPCPQIAFKLVGHTLIDIYKDRNSLQMLDSDSVLEVIRDEKINSESVQRNLS